MTHTVIIRYTTALLILLVLSVGAQADVYKCVINGVTTYSDAPCGILRQRKWNFLPEAQCSATLGNLRVGNTDYE